MPVETLIFDLDGTLVNSLPGIEFSVDQALAGNRLPARQANLRDLIGPPIRTILSTVAGPIDSSKLADLEQTFRQSYDSEGWRKTLLFDGAYDALKQAHAKAIPMFIATNKPAHVTGMILEQLAIGPFFRDVVCRDSTEPPYASKAAMLSSLLTRHGIQKDTCLFVGDTGEDLEAGRAAGLQTAIVSHGYGGAGLNGYSGYPCLEHFRELPI